MKPQTINWINSIVLIAAGLYGYFLVPLAAEEKRSVTALIPAFFGIVFFILGLLWNKAPKLYGHIAVTLALLLFIMCLLRFIKIEEWNTKKYIFLICIISNAVAVAVFVKSFIDVRRNKQLV